jgi:hypothetical protein
MRRRFAFVIALFVVSTIALPAQTPRPVLAPGNTVLIAGYACAADQLTRADALMNELTAPILNKYVSNGKIISWGYLGVYLGSPVNRQIYVWATDPVALMQARQAYLPEIMGSPKFAEFSKICGSATIALHNMIAMSGGSPK